LKKQRFFLELAYEGTAYHGWQRQPNAVSVQEVLEGAMSTLLGKPVFLTGQGRTDTGVHALKSYAHFDWEGDLPARLLFRLNHFLPSDIYVKRLFPVPENAHARFSALSRSYEYHIHTRKDPFLQGKSAYVFYPLDLPKMQAAAQALLQYQDFAVFSRSNTQVKTTICQLFDARWEQAGHRLVFKIQANRFLRNMVRAVVGTLLEIGKGQRSPDSLDALMAGKNRSDAGMSAPAWGLYLTDVEYPDWVYAKEADGENG
jgi:tRNA pseudouridine38-40 synthase